MPSRDSAVLGDFISNFEVKYNLEASAEVDLKRVSC